MSFSFQMMPKSIQLLPSPDFGVVSLSARVGVDPFYLTNVDVPTNVLSARPSPSPPAQILSENATSDDTDGGEDEAGD